MVAVLDFRLPVWLHIIQTTSIELLDPENMDAAVGISFLTHLKAEIIWFDDRLGDVLTTAL